MHTDRKQTQKWGKLKLLKFAAFTILIILLFLEAVFRIVFFAENRHMHNSVKVQGSPLQVSDDTLIFKNAAFYLDQYGRFQNNEEGMKSAPGDEFIPEKKAGDYWVLLTGASAMEGMGSNRDGKWLDITGVDDHPYNQSISFYLEKLLQSQMPDKKVRVFNAAFSASCMYQSYHRYLQLKDRIRPDWVISMDGQNEPGILAPGESSVDFIKREWNKRPQFHYPLKLIVALTSRSAFFNFIKQKMFFLKEKNRMNRAEQKDYPLRKEWAAKERVPVELSPITAGVSRDTADFNLWLSRYDSALTTANCKHLLLIQPHIFLRDTAALQETEKAVDHYYCAGYQNHELQAFLNTVYTKYAADSSNHNIVPMLSVEHWKGWVFVDYCHFSDEATQRIAGELAQYILSGGKTPVFKNQ